MEILRRYTKEIEAENEEGTMKVPRPLTQFLLGLRLSIKGCYVALTTQQVWNTHKQCYLVLLSIVSTFCFLLYIPVYIAIFMASYFVNVEQWFGDTSIQYQAAQLFSGISLYIPLVIVFVTHYLIPSFSEDVFFAALSTLEPEKSESYQATAALGFWSSWALRIKRFLRLLLMSSVAYCLSLLPLVGWTVFPITQFYLVSKIFGYKPAGVFSLAVLLVPPFRPFSWPLVKLLIGARALAIETLDPYFSRFGYEKVRLVERHHQAVMLGFAAPFLVLMSVPVLGPLFWGLVQASACVLLLATELQ